MIRDWLWLQLEWIGVYPESTAAENVRRVLWMMAIGIIFGLVLAAIWLGTGGHPAS